MKNLLTACLGALASLGLILTPMASLSATDVVAARSGQETMLAGGVVTATANYTNATTSASDIAGATITIPATNYSIARQFYRACFYADAGKATATNGTIGLSVNGSAVTAAARQIQSSAGRGSMVSCYVGARPTASAFVVKLTGVSGDTNTFTVYNAVLDVEVFYAGT